jgi:2-polyprenyl-6-methoxyphenol hydroxylase-like FAD-dependent oxidoreductase
MSVKPINVDVVIIGGGLAGATVASVLARYGLEVLVLEREIEFRDRVRGEWMAPWGMLELDALGLRHVAEGVPGANIITHHVSYDDTIAPDEAERDKLDIATNIPGGGCLGVSHPAFQQAMLTNAAKEGAAVRREVSAVRVSPGNSPTVSFEHGGQSMTAACRLVVAADGRESRIRKQLGIKLESTQPQFMMTGMLVENTHDWPIEHQATGVADDFHFLIFPQADDRVRVYGGWDIKDPRHSSAPCESLQSRVIAER